MVVYEDLSIGLVDGCGGRGGDDSDGDCRGVTAEKKAK